MITTVVDANRTTARAGVTPFKNSLCIINKSI